MSKEKETRAPQDLLADLDADIIEAASQVDITLIEWLLSLSPLDRVAWAARAGLSLKELKRADR